jgi:hypothetical protein
MRQPKVWISIFILLAIGLHAVPVLSYQGNRQTRWPILAWAMYAKSIPPGPIQMRKRRIFAFTSGGKKELVTPDLAGVNKGALTTTYVQPMWLGDSAVAQRLLRRLNREREDPFVELRMEGEKYTLVGDSVVTEEFPVLTYRLNPSGSR